MTPASPRTGERPPAPGCAAALSRPLLFVTGKGGTGKTTAALALALAAAGAGRRAIACEIGGQRQMPRLLGSRAPVSMLSIDPRRALREWLTRVVGGPGAALLTRSQTFAYFVAAAPGAREMVTLGKAWDLTRADPRIPRPAFDTVVLDGPSSGQAEGMLHAPSLFASVGRVGPVGAQAGQLRDAIADATRCAIVVVTLLTELSVSETLSFQARLQATIGRGPDLVIANQVLPDRFGAAELRRLRGVTAPTSDPLLRAAERVVLLASSRARAQAEQLEHLRAAVTAPIVELPFLAVDAIGPHELQTLSELLSTTPALPLSDRRASGRARARVGAGG